MIGPDSMPLMTSVMINGDTPDDPTPMPLTRPISTTIKSASMVVLGVLTRAFCDRKYSAMGAVTVTGRSMPVVSTTSVWHAASTPRETA